MAKVNKAVKAVAAAAMAASVGPSLADIVAATKAQSFLYVAEADVAELLASGHIELNHSMVNEAGEIAARATVMGMAEIDGDSDEGEREGEGDSNASAGGFVLEDNVAIPKSQRGGRRGEIYPFDKMAVGQSFFVAATAEKPEPAKSLASTVTSATARYAVGTGEFHDVKVKVYQINEAGERVRDANGKLIVVGETTERREIMKETRKFTIRAVEEKGVKGARIWRTA